jgi:hypothetical protein
MICAYLTNCAYNQATSRVRRIKKGMPSLKTAEIRCVLSINVDFYVYSCITYTYINMCVKLHSTYYRHHAEFKSQKRRRILSNLHALKQRFHKNFVYYSLDCD